MRDTSEIASRLYEMSADLAFERQNQIEEAAKWCKANYPHKFEYLNEMYGILVEEDRHMSKLGLGDGFRSSNAKRSPVLLLLTPNQALRLLEAYKRATANDPKTWRAKEIKAIEAIESDKRRDTIVAEIKEKLREQRHGPTS